MHRVYLHLMLGQKTCFKGVLPAINAGKNFGKRVLCGIDHRHKY